jgi:ATP-dependent DNA helicase PIF1
VPTKLFATKNKVDQTNRTMFDSLEGATYEYECVKREDCTTYSDGKKIPIELIMKCSRQPKKVKDFELDYLLNNCPIERILVLKKGANVMCTANLDIETGICNGAIGVIEEFSGVIPQPVVLFSNGVRRLMTVKNWQSEEYPTIAVGQIPLRLAWAITIHKSQGATLSMAEIDVGNQIFEYGQTYVALSRVQSLEGLYLSGLNPTKIKAHPKVCAFYAKIPTLELEEEI